MRRVKCKVCDSSVLQVYVGDKCDCVIYICLECGDEVSA